jgi:hypothetical protein
MSAMSQWTIKSKKLVLESQPILACGNLAVKKFDNSRHYGNITRPFGGS